jgi:ubiquinone/menaquinone biosynthesis C-methylase UbiE
VADGAATDGGQSRPVERAGLDGQALDLPGERFDAVLSTFTLCTIPDVDAALAEVSRVLRPGGTFHFLEHGRSPEPTIARWARTGSSRCTGR